MKRLANWLRGLWFWWRYIRPATAVPVLDRMYADSAELRSMRAAMSQTAYPSERELIDDVIDELASGKEVANGQ
jgi:hypothetical protein